MKEIKVNSCEDCPFRYMDYNDYSVGYNTMEICMLSQYNRLNDYIICIYDQGNIEPDLTSPDWCPLIKESFKIEMKNE